MLVRKNESLSIFHLFTVSSYILSWSLLPFYFFHPSKESNATFRALVTPIFLPYFIFQKVITSRVYKFKGCQQRNLLKELFFLFVILKNSTVCLLSPSLSLFFFFFFGFRWCAKTFHNNWMTCHCARKRFCLLFNLKVYSLRRLTPV